MTKSESKFRAYLKRKYVGAYIKKVPDYKQTGILGNSGLPDYLVICKRKTLWFEVKTTKSKKVFNFRLINVNQWRDFSEMMFAGATIYIGVYNGKGKLFLLNFADVHRYYVKYGWKSMPLMEV